jgi:hypothetical protein
MTRVEELTAAWLDGLASQAEQQELEGLIAAEPQARQIHLSLVDLEVVLRGARPPSAVVDEVMNQIEGQRTERAVRQVMQHVSSLTPVSRGPRARPRTVRPWMAALGVALATVALAAGLWWRARPAPVATRPVARPVTAFGISTQGAPSEPSKSQPVKPSEVLGFDFEAGALPPIFIDGALVSQECARDSRRCVRGTGNRYDPRRNTVTVERPAPPLLRFAPNQVLSFDYRAGSDGPPLRVQMWVPERHRNFSAVLPAMEHDRWAHVELRLGDLVSHRARRLATGDEISNIMITAGRRDGTPFFVDNLRVTAYPERLSLPETSALHAVSP